MTVAVPLLVGSAAAVARTVNVPAAGGAVYTPLLLIAPTLVVPDVSTLHVTAELDEPVTVAVKVVVEDAGIATKGPLTDTETTGGGVIGVDVARRAGQFELGQFALNGHPLLGGFKFLFGVAFSEAQFGQALGSVGGGGGLD